MFSFVFNLVKKFKKIFMGKSLFTYYKFSFTFYGHVVYIFLKSYVKCIHTIMHI